MPRNEGLISIYFSRFHMLMPFENKGTNDKLLPSDILHTVPLIIINVKVRMNVVLILNVPG